MGSIRQKVGEKIRQHRESLGLRQEDLENFGVSWTQYKRIERGETNTTIEVLYKIAKAFKCHPKDLLP